MLAETVDRWLFWSFFFITTLSTLLFLVILPYSHRGKFFWELGKVFPTFFTPDKDYSQTPLQGWRHVVKTSLWIAPICCQLMHLWRDAIWFPHGVLERRVVHKVHTSAAWPHLHFYGLSIFPRDLDRRIDIACAFTESEISAKLNAFGIAKLWISIIRKHFYPVKIFRIFTLIF